MVRRDGICSALAPPAVPGLVAGRRRPSPPGVGRLLAGAVPGHLVDWVARLLHEGGGVLGRRGRGRVRLQLRKPALDAPVEQGEVHLARLLAGEGPDEDRQLRRRLNLVAEVDFEVAPNGNWSRLELLKSCRVLPAERSKAGGADAAGLEGAELRQDAGGADAPRLSEDRGEVRGRLDHERCDDRRGEARAAVPLGHLRGGSGRRRGRLDGLPGRDGDGRLRGGGGAVVLAGRGVLVAPVLHGAGQGAEGGADHRRDDGDDDGDTAPHRSLRVEGRKIKLDDGGGGLGQHGASFAKLCCCNVIPFAVMAVGVAA